MKEIDEADIERLTKELLGESGWERVQHFLLHGRVELAIMYLDGAVEMATKPERIVISPEEQQRYLKRLGLSDTKGSHLSPVPKPH